MLIVAAGVLVTRLPGKPETLPAGSPPGPYFADDGTSKSVRGYSGEHYFTFTDRRTWGVVSRPVPVTVAARCDRPGDLTLSAESAGGVTPPDVRLSCRVPVGDHFEGALPLTALQRFGGLVDVVPGLGSGSWTVGLLTPLYPDRFDPAQLTTKLINGLGHPAGGSFRVTIPGTVPQAHGFGVDVLCIRDVRLEFLVSGRLLTTVNCTDDAKVVSPGYIGVLVPERTLTGLGLRPRQVVMMEVRSTGRQTDQWSVIGLG